MAKLPYFRWFPADAETDERYALMGAAELGLYHKCLNKCWINNGLPVEMSQLCKVLGWSKGQVAKSWERVSTCFFERDGRLYNRRQEEERTHAKTKSVKATSAVQTRYREPTNVGTNDLPRASDSDSDFDIVSSASSSENSETRARDGFELDEQWTDFVAAAKTVGLSGSSADWKSARWEWRPLDPLQKHAATEGLRVRDGTDDPALKSLPANYLKRRMWERAVRNNGTGSLSKGDAVTAKWRREIAEAEANGD